MKLFAKSLIIGFASIMPGISGSVIAISFGVYEKVLNIIKNRSYISNIKYLFILILGITLGIFLTANIIFSLLKYKIILYYLLLGYLIYQIPLFYKKIYKVNYLIIILSLLVTHLFSLISSVRLEMVVLKKDIVYILGGFFFSIGKIFPGVSSTFFLMILGIYDSIIKIFVNPIVLIKEISIYKNFLLGLIVGFTVSIAIFKKISSYDINILYNIILGVLLETIFCMFPGFKLEMKYIIGLILMILIYFLLKLKDIKK